MTNIDDYVSGHENDIEEFDYNTFKSELFKWSNSIEEDLKKEPYNMNLLCVNAVLNSVWDMINDNTITKNEFGEVI